MPTPESSTVEEAPDTALTSGGPAGGSSMNASAPLGLSTRSVISSQQGLRTVSPSRRSLTTTVAPQAAEQVTCTKPA